AFKRRHQTEKRDEPYRMVGKDLTSIDAIGVETAEVVVSEYGIDLSRFENEKRFVKHLQLAPHQNISAGKPTGKRKARTKGTRTGQALRTAATAAAHTATAIGAYYRRISKSKGPGVGCSRRPASLPSAFTAYSDTARLLR
ncbi:MAG: transposase, partial [Bryobacteraceae bacterium]